jgi:glucuronate isomerase
MPFIHEDFLLHSETAKRLYHGTAAPLPIIDYHCHLSPKDIAENRTFRDLTEIWLEGDHYKWRAMRANGVPESYCTGNAASYDKFRAWAQTAPKTLRNPLYHWTHIELLRYFGIDQLLSKKTALGIWRRANELLATDELRPQGILAKFRVVALCTTDDPADDLIYHKQIAASGLATKVLPAFRPDKALNVHQPEPYNLWLDRLAAAADTHIADLNDLLAALRRRHDHFHEMGCRLSDHGLSRCYSDFPSEQTAAAIFDKARSGKAASAEEQVQFASFMMLYFGRLDSEKGWTKQLHLGARRNGNTRMLQELGPDTGFDSIGDWSQIDALGAYLDRLDQERSLPKTIVYNLNPSDNYAFSTLAGNFQDDSMPGKIQFGSGWWFLDQKEAMQWQINTLSNTGLLFRFVGMLTDSRSFMSYPRHEYFRRVLCNMIGADVENGELPDDDDLIVPLIERVCYRNATEYLGLVTAETQVVRKNECC